MYCRSLRKEETKLCGDVSKSLNIDIHRPRPHQHYADNDLQAEGLFLAFSPTSWDLLRIQRHLGVSFLYVTLFFSLLSVLGYFLSVDIIGGSFRFQFGSVFSGIHVCVPHLCFFMVCDVLSCCVKNAYTNNSCTS